MANPRVFVSSTCYDLSEIRDSLDTFIRKYHFEPVLSDKGDVFYNPDIHTHDACLKEVDTCQLFILIIGGRFGGEYYKDKDKKTVLPKSITNKEYLVAKNCNIPIFTFVRRSVLENQLLYKDNKKHNPQSTSVYYSAIDKQEYAEQIFDFIDEVRLNSENNALFAFDYSREIQEILAKQWAGMFFDFLIERQRKNEVATTNRLIENLTIVTEKTEELMKKLITKQLGKDANEVINNIDTEAEAKKFFKMLFNYFGLSLNTIKKFVNDVIKLPEIEDSITWYDYVCKSKQFMLMDSIWSSTNKGKHEKCLANNENNSILIIKSQFMEEELQKTQKLHNSRLEKLFKHYLNLNKEGKERVLNSLIE